MTVSSQKSFHKRAFYNGAPASEDNNSSLFQSLIKSFPLDIDTPFLVYLLLATAFSTPFSFDVRRIIELRHFPRSGRRMS
jgi:hypothetical protein